MEAHDIKSWLPAIAMGLAAINTIWLWVRSGRLPTEEAIEKLDTCQDDHARRIQAIESEMKHIPTKDDLQAVTISLTKMLGQMDVITTELAGTSRAMRRMEDHFRGVGQ